MGSSKSEAPKYPTTTMTSGGLFGTATNNETGSYYQPSAFERKLVNFSETNALPALQEYLNPNYDSEAFHASDDYFTNKMNNVLQNNYLNGALSRGLLRGSSANDIMRGFATDLANNEYQRQVDYKNQQLANYQAAMNPYNTALNTYLGVTGLGNNLANSIANYGLSAYQAEQQANQNNGSGVGSLLGIIGGVGGSMLGGVGGGIGKIAGETIGNTLFK